MIVSRKANRNSPPWQIGPGDAWAIARPVAMPVLLGAAILFAWQLSVQWLRLPPIVLPSPGNVLTVLVANAPLIMEHGFHTVVEAFEALFISVAIGLSLGSLLSVSGRFRDGIFPNLVLLELVPKIALAPLFMIWLGNGELSRVVFSVFLSFFPIVIATLAGLNATDRSAILLCESFRASRAQIFFHVRFPYALPFVFSGIKIGSTMAVIGIIVAEFINGSRGLGYLVMFSASNMATSLMFATTLALCVFGTMVYVSTAVVEKLFALRYEVPKA
jgi:NitT/TauT family transport system permease protein